MSKNYYQPEIETMPVEQIQALQSKRLTEQVKFVYDNVKFYHDKMDEAGVKPEDIKGIEDLHKLPFINKNDLRDQYPYGLLGVPLSDCVRIQSTSGTTGRRVVAFYTQDDVDIWEECCARAIVAAGGTKDDVCHVCYGYGLFTGGPGLNGGSHKVGCLTLPMSSGNTERQLQFMTDLGSTILCCTPSYAANLGEAINERGLKDQIKLKAGIFGAEPWTEEMRKSIEESLGIKAYDIYGLTEISGPGVSFECEEQQGMHIQEDHFIAEIINPDTGEVLPEGEIGELVFTCITKKAFPLLRYRTRDLCYLTRKPCSCGRTHIRMHKPMGRSDDMMVVKGVNVWPSQIEAVLLNQGYQANYQILVDRIKNNDTIEVQVEKTPEMAADASFDAAAREKKIVAGLKSMLGIKVDVQVVEPKTIARSEGKAVRVIDKRDLYKK
ncbi:phenylacetate-CoA ligase [Lachnospiraceae bacterium MD335]|jgi:phenylacetate-CoA ligase|nr:phenylacetate-CoA ligase [Lachnospiraceae bacterium MD335]